MGQNSRSLFLHLHYGLRDLSSDARWFHNASHPYKSLGIERNPRKRGAWPQQAVIRDSQLLVAEVIPATPTHGFGASYLIGCKIEALAKKQRHYVEKRR